MPQAAEDPPLHIKSLLLETPLCPRGPVGIPFSLEPYEYVGLGESSVVGK